MCSVQIEIETELSARDSSREKTGTLVRKPDETERRSRFRNESPPPPEFGENDFAQKTAAPRMLVSKCAILRRNKRFRKRHEHQVRCRNTFELRGAKISGGSSTLGFSFWNNSFFFVFIVEVLNEKITLSNA